MVEEMDPGFRAISTLRYDPAFASEAPSPEPVKSAYYLLDYHRKRLLDAAAEFRWDEAVSQMKENLASSPETFKETLDALLPDKTRPWRLRILLDHRGKLDLEATPATSPFVSHIFSLPSRATFSSLWRDNMHITSWKVRLDTQPTQPSLFTKHKTTSRDMYNAARTRARLTSAADPVEVLLYNPKGEVMEGSITTVYFKRSMNRSVEREPRDDATWVTPPLESGGNSATTRRYALAAGICSESVVHVDTLVNGEPVWLSNGARGFMPALLEL